MAILMSDNIYFRAEKIIRQRENKMSIHLAVIAILNMYATSTRAT